MLWGLLPSNPTKFTAEDIPDQKGKIAIVTGGNTGIGYETALHLAKKNAKVYMASRNQSKALKAIENIKKECKSAKVEFLELDLQDLSSVKKAAKSFKEKHLDLLINNAGIMASPFALSKDGIEAQFATNHLGHFYFTQLLIPRLLKSLDGPRIVNVSSLAHIYAPSEGILDIEEMNDPSSMNNATRYGQSKLANILFSKGLNERYGDKIFANSVHPGWVSTDLIEPMAQNTGIIGGLIRNVHKTCGVSPLAGALTQLYVATSPDIEVQDIRAEYFTPIGNRDQASVLATSPELCEKLWKLSEDVLKEKGFLVA